jgi:hypothetical protein
MYEGGGGGIPALSAERPIFVDDKREHALLKEKTFFIFELLLLQKDWG